MPIRRVIRADSMLSKRSLLSLPTQIVTRLSQAQSFVTCIMQSARHAVDLNEECASWRRDGIWDAITCVSVQSGVAQYLGMEFEYWQVGALTFLMYSLE